MSEPTNKAILEQMWRRRGKKVFDAAAQIVQQKVGNIVEGGRVNADTLSGIVPDVNLPPRAYEHTQGAPNTTWTIAHNLGFRPNVTCFDTIPREVVGSIVHVDDNNLTVTFSASIGGVAYLS